MDQDVFLVDLGMVLVDNVHKESWLISQNHVVADIVVTKKFGFLLLKNLSFHEDFHLWRFVRLLLRLFGHGLFDILNGKFFFFKVFDSLVLDFLNSF